MTQSRFLRLQRIVADGLFGTYDHDIHLNLNDRVTLLHGPNGVGKTVILELIRALLEGHFDYIWRIPFSRLSLSFHDGSMIELLANHGTDGDDRPHLLTLTRNGMRESASVGRPSRAAFIAANFEYLHPHPNIAHTWVDIRDGEVLSSSQVVSRYGRVLSSHDDPSTTNLNWFRDFLKNANAHFIEAQRLVRMDSSFSRRHDYPKTTATCPCADDFNRRRIQPRL